ncbi:hypothetical protein N7537_009979 [Penicillium hordei]|uniref:Protein kinase domain-containing protein n=1 Tax=Penicillium hordei TaxID=40994 RepID=A0AAD6DTT3_9EURO|nr:uncharacterized protein N7537_009979 [Penicillium hordei]KAJ5593075.1 hypothetical protein N7537_009979 [Penicillium hordei]
MSLGDIHKRLKEAIYNYGTPEAFIPYDRVREVWAGDRLERFLMAHDPTLHPSHIDEAREGLLCMISILAGVVPRDWSGWSRFKQIFFPPNNVDRDRRRDKNIPNFTKKELKDNSFLGDTNLATHFVGHMWTYFPIVLNENREVSYGKHERLPLRQEKEPVVRDGGFGEVTREIIPPNHIILGHVGDHRGIPEAPYSKELIVARKRFPEKRFQVEMKQLKLLRSSPTKHERIVSHLAMFFIGKDLNIIMPWAHMDLEDFLTGGYNEMPSTTDLLKDLIQESRGVASAIHFLHKNLQLESLGEDSRHVAICHADLKPRNILVFEQEGSSTGVWRISDFGVSRVAKRVLSGTGRRDSGYSASLIDHPPRGGPYRAPEATSQRRSDVWSFGCILVRVFALGLDPESLPELDERRKESPDGHAFDDSFYRGEPPALNSTVKTWIEELSTRYRSSLNPDVPEKMQNLLSSMLQIDFQQRASARDVRTGLQALYHSHTRSKSDTLPSTQINLRDSLSGSSTMSGMSQSSTDFTSISINHPPRSVKDVGVLVNVMKYEDINQVRQILEDEVDVEQTYEGDRPLIHAIKMTNAAIIKELSKYQRKSHNRNLDVRTLSSHNQTPLYLAVGMGDVDTVRAVMDADLDPDIDAETGSDSNAGTKSLLNELCEGKTPLMHAAFLGHASVVSFLLERGADYRICVQQEKFNCLHFAVKPGNRAQADVIKAFKRKMVFDQLPPDATVDGEGTLSKQKSYPTPMMLHINLAPEDSYSSLGPDSVWGRKFKALLDGGADLNRTYNSGLRNLEKNSLQYAVQEAKPVLVQVLVGAGATLPMGYVIPPGSSRDMKKLLKNVLRERPRTRS